MRTSLPPLSLYIHIPWCVRKCPYCDFNSHKAEGELPEEAYVDALIEDLRRDLDYAQGRTLNSIFIGGGTPSLFSPAAFDRLLGAVHAALPIGSDTEITMEANPGTFEQARFAGYRGCGINRLSIGIQSFQDAFLQSLGRIHGAREALDAPAIARRAGFDNINLDLMHGLPGQDRVNALADLETACAIGPEHLSWYQLTIEPNTAFHRRPPVLPAANLVENMQETGMDLIARNGYRRYEVSAYARDGRESRHNRNYWRFGDYLGIGAGAHGKITLAETGQILRTRKTRQPAHYLDPDKDFLVESKPVRPADLPLEFMMNALRLADGVEEALYVSHTGLGMETIGPVLEKLRREGLLRPDRLAATNRGLDLLNEVLAAFLPPDPPLKDFPAALR